MKMVLAFLSRKRKEEPDFDIYKDWKPPFEVGVWAKQACLTFEDMPSLWLLKEEQGNSGSPFVGLDTGVWSIIFSFLPLQSFAMAVPLVCKRWRQVAYSDLAWKAWSKRHIVKVLPVSPGSVARTQIVCNYLYTKRFPRRVWLPPGLRKVDVEGLPLEAFPPFLKIHLRGTYLGAGASKTLRRYITGNFRQYYDPYIVGEYTKQIHGCTVEFTVVAAQEEYSPLHDKLCRSCDLLWIVHDFGKSFKCSAVNKINPIVQHYFRVKDVTWAPVVVMRTKADSDFDESRDESLWPQVREFLRHVQVPLVPVSAKENTGFDHLINLSLQMILWHRQAQLPL